MNNIDKLFELVELQENIKTLIKSSLEDLNNNELEVLIESASPYAYNPSQEPHMKTSTKLGIAAAGLAAIKSRKGLARFIGGTLSKYGSKVKVPKVPKPIKPSTVRPPALPKTWGPKDYEKMMTAKYGPVGSAPKPITPSTARPAAKPPALPKKSAAKPLTKEKSPFENDIRNAERRAVMSDEQSKLLKSGYNKKNIPEPITPTVPMNMNLKPEDLKPVDLRSRLQKHLNEI